MDETGLSPPILFLDLSSMGFLKTNTLSLWVRLLVINRLDGALYRGRSQSYLHYQSSRNEVSNMKETHRLYIVILFLSKKFN